MDYSKNIKTYYFYSTFAELLILGPILVLFLIAKGLSFTEIMVLQSISAIAVVLFEVPTGAMADKIGRKESILIGAFLWAISLGFYVVGKSFTMFILAEVIFSLGATFKSGADNALIYDSLKVMGREKEFQSIEGKARSFALYAQAVGSIIAGFVYEVNKNLPFLISVVFMLVTIIITLRFKDPPIEGKVGKYGINYMEQIKESGKFIISHEKIKAVIIFTMMFFIFYRTAFFYYQPYMEAVKIPVRYFGIIFFVFNITAAFASKRSHWIMDKTKPKTLTFMAVLMIISFVLMGVTKVWFGVFAILFQQVARGIYRPVTTKYLNKHIPSDKRATVLSFQSLACNLSVAIAFPLMGVLKDHEDIFTTHMVMGIAMIILTVLTMKYMNGRLGLNKKSQMLDV
ncbi:MFS transporter [Clostridium bowmanii]|uniref:MFS transporter n=1 Tax=Clostridium bowmanii TaxID=132925 RepID=UPI001C0BF810|nr:MFS transporter [Clostridium bowmanii]MBU3191607.1 MFS transporter [Clostridium bowmanii]MCA1075919.1 MFS transporter [Clostridium bowmanii]